MQKTRQSFPFRRASVRRNWMSDVRCISVWSSSVCAGESSFVLSPDGVIP